MKLLIPHFYLKAHVEQDPSVLLSLYSADCDVAIIHKERLLEWIAQAMGWYVNPSVYLY